jgi:hypothetical protein
LLSLNFLPHGLVSEGATKELVHASLSLIQATVGPLLTFPMLTLALIVGSARAAAMTERRMLDIGTAVYFRR